ncbi:unnamed protein product [Clavelina lepadiformis]|uniref:Transglutaminase N-terminal domain-containing protein n=1 Tax=Clavelina lepadiformis TaxID=159417 RepID=A0ABP0GZE5_CLALP
MIVVAKCVNSSCRRCYRFYLRNCKLLQFCSAFSCSKMAPTRVISRASRSVYEPIVVKSVDHLNSDNAPKHYTSDYEGDDLVVRRGFPFTLLLTLNRAILPEENLAFELRMGGRPMVHHGSLVRLPQIDPKPNEDVDGYTVLASAGENLTVKIHTSAKTTGIGKWLLVMKTTHGRRRLPYVKVSDSIVMIFNPWSKFSDNSDLLVSTKCM